MSYQWYSEVAFITVVMFIIGVVLYVVSKISLKLIMFVYEYARDYSEQLLHVGKRYK